METIEITLYEAGELREQHPDGFQRALDKYRASYWDMFGQDSVQDFMLMRADQYGFPARRELFYDLYGRGETGFAGGPLTDEESEALGRVFPDLADVNVWFRDGRLVAWGEWDDDGLGYEKEVASEWLDDLYSEMLEAGRQEMGHLESEEYFVDHAEANGWMFEDDGAIR